jgi:hypothetical protein
MFVKPLEGNNIEVIHITEELYIHYQKIEQKLNVCEYYLEEIKSICDLMTEALQKIASYEGDNEEAVELKYVADKVLWDIASQDM